MYSNFLNKNIILLLDQNIITEINDFFKKLADVYVNGMTTYIKNLSEKMKKKITTGGDIKVNYK